MNRSEAVVRVGIVPKSPKLSPDRPERGRSQSGDAGACVIGCSALADAARAALGR